MAGRKRAGKGLAPSVFDPIGKIDRNRPLGRLEQLEGRHQHFSLKSLIAGLAERTAHRELAMEHARGMQPFDLASKERERHGGQAPLFQNVGECTDGTRAQGSDGRQENDVYPVLQRLPGQGGTGVLAQRRHRFILGPRETEVAGAALIKRSISSSFSRLAG